MDHDGLKTKLSQADSITLCVYVHLMFTSQTRCLAVHAPRVRVEDLNCKIITPHSSAPWPLMVYRPRSNQPHPLPLRTLQISPNA